MGVMEQLIYIALFVAVVSQTAQADNSTAPASGGLRCYSCSSFFPEAHCDNPSEGKTDIVTCAADETMCRKIEQHITYEGGDHIRTFRECARSGELGECLERTGTVDFKSWYCQCKGDLCNSATGSVLSMTLIASMVGILFVLKGRL